EYRERSAPIRGDVGHGRRPHPAR
ncbi:MAG: hypothetical protein AVDCRST_MAG40-2162, partial [uncultured Gemmatimonadaceae bacterium]